MARQTTVEHYTDLPLPSPWPAAGFMSAPTVAALPVTETEIRIGAAKIVVRVEYDIGEAATWDCPATEPFVSALDCLINGAWVDAHDALSDAAIEQAERLTLEWMQGGA